MKRYKLFIATLLLPLLVLAGCGSAALPSISVAQPAPVSAPMAAPVPTAVSSATSSGDVLSALEGKLGAIYDQVNPSVVNIRVVQKQEMSAPSLPEIPGFRFFEPPTTPQEPQEFYRQGAGSGFVWDKEGHIITNNHVVADADKISVTFYDGTVVPGEIVGTDPDSDLAVVKVDVPANRLLPVQMFDSSQVKVGQLAVAIGNPFALEGTMTVGFVSALGRLLPVQSADGQGPGYSIPDVIQTDAPINPGNSGGVLVNDQGQVIGVTSAIISPVGASAGIGFAIPAGIVTKVVPVLINSGHYQHPWLGVSGTSLNPDLAEAMKLNSDQRGALVVDVVPGSPADNAGLQGSDRQVTIEGQDVRVGGDLITAIDGQPVKEFDDVVTYLARATDVGQEVSLTVLRDGGEETLPVILAARPKSAEAQSEPSQSGQASGAWLGIAGQTVTPQIAQAMNLPQDQEGVLVEQVEANSPADQAGLRGSYKPATIDGQSLLVGGDIITALDEQPVTQIEDLQALVRQAEPDQEVTLTILRDGEQVEVSVTLGERPGTSQ
ncbi:MAG: PDZ domain-containing protein [Anaerolineales bacterium]|nr:MAG: PDZ domain-containing protein [Anaerolineales bacterium]